MRYLPHTPEEVASMLETIGASSIDELFDSLPEEARLTRPLAVPDPVAEPDLMNLMQELAGKNTGPQMLSFLGAGLYAHHIPPAVDQLLLRSEFYTAYTPYQPEVAQGTLQAVWEFQTVVTELYGLPLANASMYDGASAAAEAAQMARRLTKRDNVVVSECVHPEYRATIKTYLSGQDDARCIEVPVGSDGACDAAAVLKHVDAGTAACIVGYPSFYGSIPHLLAFADSLHEKGALLVTSTTEPYALGVIESPGALGADIACGEGQPLASSPNFGGPGVGLFACRNERRYLQQLPGRVCGETVDKNGRRGFVLTLSTREQHIRRERATSNICTNQGLVALALVIRTSMLGKKGFEETASRCFAKAQYLSSAIAALDGYSLAHSAPFFNEFVVRVRTGSAASVSSKLADQGIVAGLALERVKPSVSSANRADQLLIAVTEKHTRNDLDRLVHALDAI